MVFLQQIITWLLSLFSHSSIAPIPTQETAPQTTPNTTAQTRHLITVPENITARFMDTGSSAWQNQFPGTAMAGRHGGTDFSAPQGSSVYAPYPMRVIAVGYYPDAGRKGYYVIGILGDGIEYYSGHLQNVKTAPSVTVPSGAVLGETNDYNHTHIQMKRAGQIIDPEGYLASHP